MKQGYDYAGKHRKEVWLTGAVLTKIARAAKKIKPQPSLKSYMEQVLVNSTKNKKNGTHGDTNRRTH